MTAGTKIARGFAITEEQLKHIVDPKTGMLTDKAANFYSKAYTAEDAETLVEYLLRLNYDKHHAALTKLYLSRNTDVVYEPAGINLEEADVYEVECFLKYFMENHSEDEQYIKIISILLVKEWRNFFELYDFREFALKYPKLGVCIMHFFSSDESMKNKSQTKFRKKLFYDYMGGKYFYIKYLKQVKEILDNYLDK